MGISAASLEWGCDQGTCLRRFWGLSCSSEASTLVPFPSLGAWSQTRAIPAECASLCDQATRIPSVDTVSTDQKSHVSSDGASNSQSQMTNPPNRKFSWRHTFPNSSFSGCTPSWAHRPARSSERVADFCWKGPISLVGSLWPDRGSWRCQGLSPTSSGPGDGNSRSSRRLFSSKCPACDSRDTWANTWPFLACRTWKLAG